MTKRVGTLFLIILVVGAAGFFLLARRPNPQELTLLPRASAATSAWPLDRTWSWSFPLPAAPAPTDGICLRIRQSSSPIPPGQPPVHAYPEKPMPAAQAGRELTTSIIVFGHSPETRGTATLQLLDLARIGAASTRPGQNLRALATLAVGGASTPIEGDAAILPAGRIAGTAPRDRGQWSGNELYLMTFFIESEDQLHRCDVLLEHIPTTRP